MQRMLLSSLVDHFACSEGVSVSAIVGEKKSIKNQFLKNQFRKNQFLLLQNLGVDKIEVVLGLTGVLVMQNMQ